MNLRILWSAENQLPSPVAKQFTCFLIHLSWIKKPGKTAHFRQWDHTSAFFIPFDGDGDENIATIAFFPDYPHQPEEGFVFSETKGIINPPHKVYLKEQRAAGSQWKQAM
jgi:hypothetical protein